MRSLLATQWRPHRNQVTEPHCVAQVRLQCPMMSQQHAGPRTQLSTIAITLQTHSVVYPPYTSRWASNQMSISSTIDSCAFLGPESGVKTARGRDVGPWGAAHTSQVLNSPDPPRAGLPSLTFVRFNTLQSHCSQRFSCLVSSATQRKVQSPTLTVDGSRHFQVSI